MTRTPSKTAIKRSLKSVGVTGAVLKRALPECWEDKFLENHAGFLQFNQLIEQRLGIRLSVDGTVDETYQSAPVMKFKKIAAVNHQTLVPASRLCQVYARTFIRTLSDNSIRQKVNGLSHALSELPELSLQSTLVELERRAIPVIYVKDIPQGLTRPAGMVINEDGYYAITLSHKHKSCASQLFVLLHEIGHIALGHMDEGSVITDATISSLGETLRTDNDRQEDEADQFALRLLRGKYEITPYFNSFGREKRPASLCKHARIVESETGIDASHYILSYGSFFNDWVTVQQALNYIERENAQNFLKASMDRQIAHLSFEPNNRELISHLRI